MALLPARFEEGEADTPRAAWASVLGADVAGKGIAVGEPLVAEGAVEARWRAHASAVATWSLLRRAAVTQPMQRVLSAILGVMTAPEIPQSAHCQVLGT